MTRRQTGAKVTQGKDRSEIQVVQQEEDTPLPPAEELERLKRIDEGLVTKTIEMVEVENKRQLPAFFYSLPRGSLKTATVA